MANLGTGIIYGIVILLGLICLLPMLNILAISFSSSDAAAANIVGFVPVKFTTAAYNKIMEDRQFWRSFGISVFRVASGLVVNLVLIVLMAYPLSKTKREFRGRNIYMNLLIFAMLFSGGMIPTYLVVKTFKLSNTIWALIIPSLLNVYNMIIMRTFFEGISEELEDAARIDGCSEWKTLLKIVLPVSKPTLASIALFYAVWHWNSFFDVVLYITDRKLWPLQTLLREVVLTMSMAELNAQMADVAAPPSSSVIAATVMVSTVPILAVYPFLQKYFVKGVMVGAVKG